MQTPQGTEYQIEQLKDVLSHDSHLPAQLRDGYGNVKLDELDAIIRSGQYFVTVATELDLLASELKKGNEIQEHHLQKIINELLFIQGHYKIKKRKKL